MIILREAKITPSMHWWNQLATLHEIVTCDARYDARQNLVCLLYGVTAANEQIQEPNVVLWNKDNETILVRVLPTENFSSSPSNTLSSNHSEHIPACENSIPLSLF